MSTIVVHGTMTLRSAKAYSWWWNSWHQHGFLQSVAEGMKMQAGYSDVWRVNGTHVSEIDELNPSWSFFSGSAGKISQYKGHFIWSGADMGAARDAGAYQLAHYLNAVVALTDEPIRIIAHSHGCNIVKNASSHRKLSEAVYIDRAVFLACPHFFAEAADRLTLTYRLDPHRFGSILNLYSSKDTVQVGFADAITGPPGARFADWSPPTAARYDMDPDTEHLYEDVDFPTEAEGTRAHTVMHGSLVGGLVGMWLNSSGTFNSIVSQFDGPLPPVSADDDGA